MVDYYELANTDLSKLDAAATSFETLLKNWDLSSSYASQIVGPLRSSDWTGASATAAAGPLTNTRTQIDEAFTETSAIAAVLREAHDKFAAAQKTLAGIQADATSQGMTIDANGAVHWPPPKEPAQPQIPGWSASRSAVADGIADRIANVLSQVTADDSVAAAALSGDAGGSSHAFNATPVGGMTEEYAAQAAALARQGSKLTDAQVAQLDTLLKANADDPRFSTAFYQDLGPKGALTSWGQLSESSSMPGTTAARLASLADLQANLGKALATATQPGNTPHLSDAWEAQLRAVGSQRLQLDPDDSSTGFSPYGYQVLSNIMRTGTYSPHFLDPIAEHVTQLTEANGEMWLGTMPEPGSDIRLNLLSNSSASAGFDPLSGILDSLGHSPAASTDFFSNRETLYNANGTATGKTAPNGYLTYLADPNRRSLFPDTTLNSPAAIAAAGGAQQVALGNALSSATLGVPYDAPGGTAMPRHTEAMGNVMSQVVTTFGQDPTLLSGDGAPFAAINATLAKMSASYMGNIQRSLAATSEVAAQLPTYDSDIHKVTTFNAADTQQLLETFGRDPSAYGILTQAQQAYTAAALQTVAKLHTTDQLLTQALAAPATAGGYVAGVLNAGKANQMMSDHLNSDAAWNSQVDQAAGWANTLWSMTGGDKVGDIPGIAAIPGGSDIVNDQVSDLISSIASGYKRDTVQTAVNQISQFNVAAFKTTAQTAANATKKALQGSGLSSFDIGVVSGSVGLASQSGFNGGQGIDVIDHGGWTVS